MADARVNTHRVPLIVVGVVFSTLGTLVVFLRLWIRRFVAKSAGGDDCAILLAWLCSIGFLISVFLGVRYGLGSFTNQVAPADAKNSLEAAFYLEIFYYFTIYLVKVSFLVFYFRLTIGVRRSFYKAIIFVLVLVTAQFISTVVVVFLQCRPISFYWDQSQPGTCIDITAFFYSTNIFTIITDVMILVLPISTLARVKQAKIARVGLVGVFGAGALSTVASCVRLYTIRVYTVSTDPIYDSAPITTWSFIEINLGMICASAPALKVLFGRFRNNVSVVSNSTNPPTIGSVPSKYPIASEHDIELQEPIFDDSHASIHKTSTMTHTESVASCEQTIQEYPSERVH